MTHVNEILGNLLVVLRIDLGETSLETRRYLAGNRDEIAQEPAKETEACETILPTWKAKKIPFM